MAMKKTYYTVAGELIGEKTTGGSRTDYLTDALGSVTATVNQSAQLVNTYRYKPYGSLLAKTGTGADPSYTFVGSKGYRQTGNKYGDTYVRARTYSSVLGRWTTPDPIRWRGGDWNYYGYVHQRPTVGRDPSGLVFDPFSCSICAASLGLIGAGLYACTGDPRGFSTCVFCFMIHNPILTLLLLGTAGYSCSICIPGLLPIIRQIGPGLITGGGILAGAPAIASTGNFLLKDPCNPSPVESCPPQSIPWPTSGSSDDRGRPGDGSPKDDTGPLPEIKYNLPLLMDLELYCLEAVVEECAPLLEDEDDTAFTEYERCIQDETELCLEQAGRYLLPPI